LKHAYLKVFVLCYHLEVDLSECNQFLSYLMYENLTAYSVSTLIVIWPYHFWRHFEVTKPLLLTLSCLDILYVNCQLLLYI